MQPAPEENGAAMVPQPDTGERIKAKRTELGLSQREVSTPRASYAYVSRVEAGKRTPSLMALVEIAQRLKTTALFLATGDYQAHCPVCGRTSGPIKDLNGGPDS